MLYDFEKQMDPLPLAVYDGSAGDDIGESGEPS